MGHPPAFQIDVRAGLAWCWAVSVLAALSAASVLWWLMYLLRPQDGSQILRLLLAGGMSVLLAYFSGRGLRRQAPRSLRWDGQIWLLGSAVNRGSEKRQGKLMVVLDLGDWMLLRHRDLVPHRFKHGASYLALSRTDLPQQWHVLRGTLYSTTEHASAVPRDAGTH